MRVVVHMRGHNEHLEPSAWNQIQGRVHITISLRMRFSGVIKTPMFTEVNA